MPPRRPNVPPATAAATHQSAGAQAAATAAAAAAAAVTTAAAAAATAALPDGTLIQHQGAIGSLPSTADAAVSRPPKPLQPKHQQRAVKNSVKEAAKFLACALAKARVSEMGDMAKAEQEAEALKSYASKMACGTRKRRRKALPCLDSGSRTGCAGPTST